MSFNRIAEKQKTPRVDFRRPDHMPKSSWWIAANRDEFQQSYRAHQSRIIANNAPVPTAKEHGSSRQEAGLRKVNHMLATVSMDPIVSDE